MIVTLDATIDLRSLPGPGGLKQLLTPFSGRIDGADFTIPKGFVTDLASVPRIFRNIIDDNAPDIERPSVLHDWLYQFTGSPPYASISVTRAGADLILRAAMEHCGASWLRRWTVWSAVRIGGAFCWHPHSAAHRRTMLRSATRHGR